MWRATIAFSSSFLSLAARSTSLYRQRRGGEKRVSGNFDLNDPKSVLDTVAARTGLIWYDDGSSVYIYDTSEIQSSVVRLAFAPYDRLVAYLQSSGLYDPRFPLRSDGRSGSFYVSGPPVYVELVSAAAKYIDATYAKPGTGETTIRVIKLKNTFVNDRNYTQRDVPISVPGVATVLNQLLNNTSCREGGRSAPAGAIITVDNDTRSALEAASATQKVTFRRCHHLTLRLRQGAGRLTGIFPASRPSISWGIPTRIACLFRAPSAR